MLLAFAWRRHESSSRQTPQNFNKLTIEILTARRMAITTMFQALCIRPIVSQTRHESDAHAQQRIPSVLPEMHVIRMQRIYMPVYYSTVPAYQGNASGVDASSCTGAPDRFSTHQGTHLSKCRDNVTARDEILVGL
jgi:hypothetical protein